MSWRSLTNKVFFCDFVFIEAAWLLLNRCRPAFRPMASGQIRRKFVFRDKGMAKTAS
jgi:hypothetical protein